MTDAMTIDEIEARISGDVPIGRAPKVKPWVDLMNGDCLLMLKELDANSVDAVVTDPPYGLSFMGKHWDYDVPGVDIWREVLRVLKPGGHLLSFGGSRTYHRMAVSIEDAGFEIRDQIMWLYGSGFPKSSNQDGDWEGWGTALKPAHEPIVVARKPLIGTVAANVLRYGTGGINVDGCRVGTGEDCPITERTDTRSAMAGPMRPVTTDATAGRWPANVVLDEAAAERLDAEVGELHHQNPATRNSTSPRSGVIGFADSGVHYDDRGGPSRFFYTAKASKKDRGVGNTHPTVKPTKLMRWLVRMVTPPGGVVLDPFAGSGSTLVAARMEGFDCIGIEREPEYHAIILSRLEAIEPEQMQLAS